MTYEQQRNNIIEYFENSIICQNKLQSYILNLEDRKANCLIKDYEVKLSESYIDKLMKAKYGNSSLDMIPNEREFYKLIACPIFNIDITPVRVIEHINVSVSYDNYEGDI